MAATLAHNQLYSNGSHGSQPAMHWHKRPLEGAEDDCTFDDNTAGSKSFDMAAADPNHRRESFASNASLLSPTHQTWTDFPYNPDAPSDYPMTNNHPTGLFPDHAGGSFPYQDVSSFAHSPHQAIPWQQQSNLGHDATNNGFNAFTSDVDTIKPEAPYTGEIDQNQPANTDFGGLPVHMESDYSQYPASAASPQWSTSSSDAVEKIPRSSQFQSSLFNLNPPHLRRDGVRKKNARFEIPEGRNLQTIDELINSTNPNNEDEIKELKQQKRLLRNRQAALDSRCRKKHHTEKLEEEKKHFLAHIDRLEEDHRGLLVNEQRWMHERQQWHQYCESLVREKEELLRQHTLETAELRRKNNYLMEETHRLEEVAMSAQSSSSGVPTGFPDFEHLTMNGSPFDDFSFVDTQRLDMEIKQDPSLTTQSKRESPTPTATDDKTAASGLLLMLLLCGAWVASKSTSSTSAPIPRMPDDVRHASAVVLENIYKDAGLQTQQVSASTNVATTSMIQPGTAHISVNGLKGSSPLVSLHHELITPSQQQQRDQAFSLTVDQYNHITSDDLGDETPSPGHMPPRRNLGAALAALRAQKHGPAAEVYTRSLMLDNVPADVVKDFARMMEESKRGEPLS